MFLMSIFNLMVIFSHPYIFIVSFLIFFSVLQMADRSNECIVKKLLEDSNPDGKMLSLSVEETNELEFRLFIASLALRGLPFIEIVNGKEIILNTGGNLRILNNLPEILRNLSKNDEEAWALSRTILKINPMLAFNWVSNIPSNSKSLRLASFQFGSRKNYRRIKQIMLQEHEIHLPDPVGEKRRKRRKKQP